MKNRSRRSRRLFSNNPPCNRKDTAPTIAVQDAMKNPTQRFYSSPIRPEPGAGMWPHIERPKVGLALSSGAARGLAHIGVIQLLEERGIVIDAIAGASMGAYVGALWAAGYSGREMEGFAAEITSPRDLWKRLDLALPPVKGLIYGHGIRSRLADALSDMTFEQLQRELHIVTTNIDTYQRRVFSKGDVASAVHASAAVPGLCVPVEIEGHRYIDGGVVDPLPVSELRHAGCDIIIAVNVLPSITDVAQGLATTAPKSKQHWLSRANSTLNVFAPGNVVETLRRAVFSAQIRLAEESAHQADIVIRPTTRARWHDYHRYADYIAAGRLAAAEFLPSLSTLPHEPHPPERHENYPDTPSLVS